MKQLSSAAQSAIRNPQSAIRNPQSAIRNPQSAIRKVRYKGYKITIILLMFVSYFQTATPQPLGNYAKHWVFGRGTASSIGIHLQFTPTVSYVDTVPNYENNEGSACISDPSSGDLLFYTDGQTVYNASGSIHITGLKGNNANSIGPGTYSTQSSIIIPKPGSSSRYIIFTTSAINNFAPNPNNSNGLKWHEVNCTGPGDTVIAVSLNNDLVPNALQPNSRATEKLCAIRHANGVDYWVLSLITNLDNNDYNTFHAYLVTSAGVSGPIITNDTRRHASLGQMKFSSACRDNATGSLVDLAIANTTIFALLYGAGGPSTTALYLYQFNIQTGQVITNTNPSLMSAPSSSKFYGVEFSSTGNYLYTCTFSNTTAAQLFRYDITTQNVVVLATFPPNIQARALQIGIDNKIYVTQPGDASNIKGGFHVIDTPDSPTSTITFYSPWGNNVEPSASVSNFYVTPRPCSCDATIAYNQIGDTTISVSTTWTAGSNPWSSTTIPKINGNIIIAPGATLNLRGITLEFSPSSKIIVQENARLDMRSNTVLKAVGTCMWEGVENIVNPFSPPALLASPGRVFMRNSTIQDARVGIALGRITGSGIVYFAGLVNIESSLFLNNHIGMHFKARLPDAYTLPSTPVPVHRVVNTTFRCTGSLKETFNPLTNPSNRTAYFQLVTTPGIERLQYENIATFNTYQNIPFTAPNQTTAIYSSSLGFRVESSTFTNTQYGVFMISSPVNMLSLANILSSTFNRNLRAITILGANGIVRDNYLINGISNPTFMPTVFDPWGIGIYTDGTGALTIRENSISGFDIGAAVDNASVSGFVPEILGNTFTNNYLYCLGTGGDNSTLKVACNNFNNYVTNLSATPPRIGAWYVYDYSATVPASMAQQGDPFTPAGNRFNSPLSSSFDIYTKTTNPAPVLFTYYYGGVGAFFPNPVSTNVNRIFNGANPTAYCASLLGPPMYPRMASVILARLATASTRQDSLSLYTELYFHYLENQDTAGVRSVLMAQNTPSAKRALVEYYLNVKAAAQANAILSTLPTTTPDEFIFKQYYTMQANHVLANRPCHTIDSTQENTVRTWRGQRGSLMGVLMSSLHRNCGDSVWVDCQMLGLCSGSSSRYIQQNTDIVAEQKANTAYLGDAYPNPVQDVVHIPYQLSKESGVIEIYNIFGIKVHTYTVSDVYGVLNVPVSELPKGMYIYTLTTQNGERISTKKFMVQ